MKFQRHPKAHPSLPLTLGILLVMTVGCSGGDQVEDGIFTGETDPLTDLALNLIPNGSFEMGSDSLDADPDEAPVHTVTLSRPFFIGQTEITQEQFESRMGYQPTRFLLCESMCPLETITWHEAAAFANHVSTEAGLASCYACEGSEAEVLCSAPTDPYSCEGYRLPTEAEWEYAARARENTLYAGSDAIDDVASYEEEDDGPTYFVASLQANAWGLYDMSGNVWEWVGDGYGDYPSEPVTDPLGSLDGTQRVLRGGSWNNDPRFARVASRAKALADYSRFDIGLRLARTVPAP